MIINRDNMDTLASGFRDAFARGLTTVQARSNVDMLAIELQSMTAQEVYAWLAQFPQMEEWVGERTIRNMKQEGRVVRNRDWEIAIGVDRNHVMDDRYGAYGALFAGMGSAVSGHIAELVFGTLKDGFTKDCYDGQMFFDTDHPVGDGTYANTDADSIGAGSNAAGTPWFLCDLSMEHTRPIILQMRKRADNILRRDEDSNDNAFERREYLYGVDGRYNTACGFWQGAYGSKAALTKEAFKAAFSAIESVKGEAGRPLGLSPAHLLVPPALRESALLLVNAERNEAAPTNVWSKTVEPIVSPWLA